MADEKLRRFHPIYGVHRLRKLFWLCLLPPLRALLLRSLPAVWTALRQEALLLALLTAGIVLVWHSTGWQLAKDRLTVRRGVLVYALTGWDTASISCVSVEQGPVLRACGAARVQVYFAARPGGLTLYLPRREAVGLADALLPAPTRPRCYRPRGYDRLGLVAVSANLLTALALWIMTVQSLPDHQLLTRAAQLGLDQTRALIAPWVGAGLSGLLAAVALLWTGAVLMAVSRTAFFRVETGQGVLHTQSGLFTHIDRRIRTASITGYVLHSGPAARVLRRFPVHLVAGGFDGRDLPVFLMRPTAPDEPAELLPGCTLAPRGPVDRRDRSVVSFFLAPGLAFGLTALLAAASGWKMPEVTPPLVALLAYWGALLFCSAEAFCHECVRLRPDGTPVLRYTRFFTHYTAVLIAPAVLTVEQNPFSHAVGRCNARFTLPGGWHVRLRSLPTRALLRCWRQAARTGQPFQPPAPDGKKGRKI